MSSGTDAPTRASFRPSGVNLEEFLGRRFVDRHRFLGALRDALNLDPEATAYISGSLCEATGNDRSDVDVYVIVRSPGTIAPTWGRTSSLLVEGVVIDVEYWPLDAVERALQRLETRPFDEVRDAGHVMDFSSDEVEFLHRLSIGQPVHNSDRFNGMRDRVDRRAVARLVFDKAALRVGTAHEDMLGLVDRADFVEARLAGIGLVGFLADVILSACGDSCPSEKSRLRRLRGLRSTDWDADLPGGRFGEDPDQWLAASVASLASGDDGEAVREAVAMANRLVPWGQHLFAEGAVPVVGAFRQRQPSVPNADLGVGSPTRRLPPLRLDLQVRWIAERVRLFPVGGHVGLSLNRLAQEAAVLFDGVTTERMAINRLVALSGEDAATVLRALADLEIVLQTFA